MKLVRNIITNHGLTTRVLLTLGLSVLVVGCIEFEGQSLTYRHDKKKDRLLIFQVYENIHAKGEDQPSPGDSPPSRLVPSSEEIKQLESVMKGQRTFFFGNWITEYDRRGISNELARIEDDLPTAAPEDVEYLRKVASFYRIILDSVTVTNGSFYLNDKGQLCAYQYVIVTDLSKVVSRANDLASAYVVRDLRKPEMTNDFSAASREKIMAFAKNRKWIVVRGNEIRFKSPCTQKDYKGFEDFLGEDSGLCLKESVATTYSEPFCDVLIGKKKQESQELKTQSSDEALTNLVAYVRSTYGIVEGVYIEKIRDDFLKTGR